MTDTQAERIQWVMKDSLEVVLGRFEKLVDILPRIEAEVVARYPEGSYERKALARFKEVAPDFRYITKRIREVNGQTALLPQRDKEKLHTVALALQDARALIQETDFDTTI
jgi:hypothetical protein